MFNNQYSIKDKHWLQLLFMLTFASWTSIFNNICPQILMTVHGYGYTKAAAYS